MSIVKPGRRAPECAAIGGVGGSRASRPPTGSGMPAFRRSPKRAGPAPAPEDGIVSADLFRAGDHGDPARGPAFGDGRGIALALEGL